jgi:hypothetical protein
LDRGRSSPAGTREEIIATRRKRTRRLAPRDIEDIDVVQEPVGESDFSASRLPLVAVRNRSSHNISTQNVLLRQALRLRRFANL